MRRIRYKMVNILLYVAIIQNLYSCSNKYDSTNILCGKDNKFWRIYYNGNPSNLFYYFNKNGIWERYESDPFLGVRKECSDVLYTNRWILKNDSVLVLDNKEFDVCCICPECLIIKDISKTDTLYPVNYDLPYKKEKLGCQGFNKGKIFVGDGYKFWVNNDSNFVYFDDNGKWFEFRKKKEKFVIHYGLYDNLPRKWRMETDRMVRISDILYQITTISKQKIILTEYMNDSDSIFLTNLGISAEKIELEAVPNGKIPQNINHRW